MASLLLQEELVKPSAVETVKSPTGEMVCGFYFDYDSHNVLLIRRTNPKKSHLGKINGLGGKINVGESPIDAMVREFYEEAGIATHKEKWQPTIIIKSESWRIHLFRTFGEFAGTDYYHECEEGIVSFYDPNRLPDNVMNNLNWIIPLHLGLCGAFVDYELELPQTDARSTDYTL